MRPRLFPKLLFCIVAALCVSNVIFGLKTAPEKTQLPHNPFGNPLIPDLCADPSTIEGKEYDVYLLIGQSNMAGRGEFEAADTVTPIKGVWLLDAEGNPETAVPPLNKYSPIRKALRLQGYSLANNFSRLMHERTGRKILLVVNAKGGSSIMSWQPGHKDGFLNEAVRRTREALKHGKLKGILWHQGETNVQKDTPDYAGKFYNMITALRDSIGEGNVPVVIGQVGRWEWAPLDKIAVHNDSVVPEISKKVPNCTYVTSEGLGRLFKDNPRDPHFSREAQIELGRRYAEAMTRLQKEVTTVKQKK